MVARTERTEQCETREGGDGKHSSLAIALLSLAMDVSVSALGYYKEAAPPDLFARAPQQAKVKMSISPRWFPSPRIRNNM